MPSRLPVRPAKIIGNLFVLFVLVVISLIYYTYVIKVWAPRLQTHLWVPPMLAVFHFLFIMLLWSFFQSMLTDPGQVPAFWGFHIGDPENKRRRYCLMCNVFKPERCHHCSACNRCVLNMDHHCPWINNCVGFWNRKYFMILLVSVWVTTYFVIITLGYDFLMSIKWEIDAYYWSNTPKDQEKLFHNLIIQLSYILNCMIAVLMTFFLKFHIYLVQNNKTTIENLDKKGKTFRSIYDIGASNNWYQVFGTNKWWWIFPIFPDSAKPLGDGIYWPTNQPSEDNYTSNSQKSADRRSVISPQKSEQQNQRGYPPGFTPASQGSYRANLGGQFGGGYQDQTTYNQHRGLSNDPTPEQQQRSAVLQYGYGDNRQVFNPSDAQNFPYNQARYGQQPDNRIILHQEDKEAQRRNINMQILQQNHQRAQQLHQSLAQQRQQQQMQGQGKSPQQLQYEQQLKMQQQRVAGAGQGRESESGKMQPKKRKDPKGQTAHRRR